MNFKEKNKTQCTRNIAHFCRAREAKETEEQAYTRSSHLEAPAWENLIWKKQFISREWSSKSCCCHLRKGKGHWFGKEEWPSEVLASAPGLQTELSGSLSHTCAISAQDIYRVSVQWHLHRIYFIPFDDPLSPHPGTHTCSCGDQRCRQDSGRAPREQGALQLAVLHTQILPGQSTSNLPSVCSCYGALSVPCSYTEQP